MESNKNDQGIIIEANIAGPIKDGAGPTPPRSISRKRMSAYQQW